MEKLDKEELIAIVGGWSLTGTLINAFTSAGKAIYSAGQSFGSSLRRIKSNTLCPIR